MMKDEFIKCECCKEILRYQWSDTHGVGVCITCGAPYRIYFYEDDKRVEKPPEISLNHEAIEIAKRYWNEEHSRVFPAICSFMPARGGNSYCGASMGDVNRFNKWMDENYPTEENVES